MTDRLLRGLVLILIVARGAVADVADPGWSALWAAAASGSAGLVLWQRRPMFRSAAVLWSLLLWAGVATLSISWSAAPFDSFQAALQLAATSLLALAIAVDLGQSRSGPAWAPVLAGAWSSAEAARQYLYGFPAAQRLLQAGELSVDSWTRQLILEQRPMGTFLSPDLLGGAMAVAMLLCVGLIASERGRLRAAAAVVLAMLGLGFVLSRSVGASLALGAGAAVFALSFLCRRAQSTKSRGLVAIGVLITLILALMAGLPRLEGIEKRGRERLVNQETALRAWQQAPLLGHGHNSFGVIAPGLRQGREPLTLYAHGLLGQTLGDLGACGGVAVLLLLFTALARIARSACDEEERHLLRAAAAAATAGLVHGLVDYDLVFGESQLFLFVALALCMPGKAPVAQGKHPLGAVLLALAVAVAALSLWRGAGSAQVALARGEEDCRQRALSLEAAAGWAPPDPLLYRSLALAWLACDEVGPERSARAAMWAERAWASSPNNATLRAEYAFALAAAGRGQQALAEAEAAVAQWPRVGRVYAYRGLVELHLGRVDGARLWLQTGRQLNPQDSVVRRLGRALEAR